VTGWAEAISRFSNAADSRGPDFATKRTVASLEPAWLANWLVSANFDETLARKNALTRGFVRPSGFEPETCGLRVRCSAVELEARPRV
jgi:hypothetical protein